MVGFELWEILTMLTIVLSLASAIMWYSNFQPKQAETQIAMIEKQKHVIYNNYNENQVNLSKNLTKSDLGKDCKTDISNQVLDTTDLDQELAKIQSLRQSSIFLQDEIKQKTNILNNQSEVIFMQNDYLLYLSDVEAYRQDQFQFKKTSFLIDVLVIQAKCEKYQNNIELKTSLDQLVTKTRNSNSLSVSGLNQPLADFLDKYTQYSKDISGLEQVDLAANAVLSISFDYDTNLQKLIYIVE